MPRRKPGGAISHVECRRRPTLPHPGECSTIGAGGLSFRVRDGTGRSPSATTTDNTIQLSPLRGVEHTTPTPTPGKPRLRVVMVVCSGSHSGCEQQYTRKTHAELVLWASPRPISTGRLHPSQSFHPRPINPIVSRGPYPRKGGGRPHLGTSFPLRCLQRLSLPNIANQPCPWRDNWHTRGPSVPVLSY
jgi:hypothetical protein